MTRSGQHRFALALVALCIAPSAFAQEEEADAAAKEKTSKAETYKVKQESFKIEVNLSGVFEADKMWPISLRPKSWSAFEVVEAVEHGTFVKKGMPLVKFDTTSIDEKLQDLEYEKQTSQLSQQLLDLDLELLKTTTPLDLELAERTNRIAAEDLRYFLEVNRAQQEKSATFSLKSSQNSLEYAREELEQLEKMYKADDLTEETEEIVLKRARNDVERSEYFLETTQLLTKKTLETELPRQEEQSREAARRASIALDKAKVTLPTQLKKQQIEREKQTIAFQRSDKQLKELQADRQMMVVKSPVDGVVYYGQCKRGKWSGVESVASQLQEGGSLSAKNVFMTVVIPRPLHVRVDVPEKELHLLRQGLRGTAVPTGFPNMELSVAVQHVSRLPIATGMFDGHLQVVVGNEAESIVPGMNCKLTLVAYENNQAIAVPVTAVFKNEPMASVISVYVVDEKGNPTQRTVVVGQKTEKKWEIVKGLAAGETILLKKPDA